MRNSSLWKRDLEEGIAEALYEMERGPSPYGSSLGTKLVKEEGAWRAVDVRQQYLEKARVLWDYFLDHGFDPILAYERYLSMKAPYVGTDTLADGISAFPEYRRKDLARWLVSEAVKGEGPWYLVAVFKSDIIGIVEVIGVTGDTVRAIRIGHLTDAEEIEIGDVGIIWLGRIDEERAHVAPLSAVIDDINEEGGDFYIASGFQGEEVGYRAARVIGRIFENVPDASMFAGGGMKRNADDSFMKRRREQLEREHEERMREELAEAALGREEHEAEEEPLVTEARSPLPRRLATEYHAVTQSWMHRFADVRSDDEGFYILHGDNPDGWRMRAGDLLQDVALNTQPYWEVTDNDRWRKRVNLRPIGLNPFLTGVGAGGARITKADLGVLTGEYEEEAIEAIMRRLESGEAKHIDQVKYILVGTVGLNFGPNGPQGGWYNAGDTRSNRGGRMGLSSSEIVAKDATTLRDMGFAVSDLAVAGEIDPHEWTSFVEQPAGYFKDWRDIPPTDLDIYRERQMAAYERRGLLEEGWRRENLLGGIDEWEKAIDLWQSRGGLTVSEIERLSDVVDWRTRNKLKYIWKLLAFSTPLEEPLSMESAMALLHHEQSDVQMRAVSRCIMHVMSADDEDVERCLAALLRFIQGGRGYWLVNEQVIEWAVEEGYEDILLAATRLPEAINRKWAYGALAKTGHPAVRQAIFTERDPEVLGGIAWSLRGGYGQRRQYLPSRHETDFLMHRLTDILEESHNIIERVQARDALVNLMPIARKQELDVQRARAALDEYDRQKNPAHEASDLEWLALARSHMERTIAELMEG